jgi:SPP1 family predicted phage head-tail adaptor
MRWIDELTLIKEIPQGTDDNGFPLAPAEEATEVFANKKSVGYNEFYQAQRAGYNSTLKFDVYTAEYTGQTAAEYDGKRYMILRSWLLGNGDEIELTLTDEIRKREGSLFGG